MKPNLLSRCTSRSIIPLVALFTLISTTGAWSRVWTNSSGKTMEAELVRADETHVVVNRDGKEFTIPLSNLAESDREHVKEWLAKQKTDGAANTGNKAPAAQGVTFDGKPLTRGGKVNLYEYKYDDETLKIVQKAGTQDTGFRIGLAVPADFDPSKPQKVFIVNAPGNNDKQRSSGNTGAMGSYAKMCVDAGWLCLGYDTNLGRVRHTLDLVSCFQLLARVWPQSKSWKFAVGGFSGGAKSSFYPCGFLIKHEFNVLGMFLAGCNREFSEQSRKDFKLSASKYKDLRIFLSTGDKDSYVNEGQLKSVLSSLRSNGIRKVRSERFKGGHTIHQPHITEALKWFESND